MFCRKKQNQSRYNSVPTSDDQKKTDNATEPIRGDTTEVSGNHIARLMYYLHCVKNCVNVDISANLVDFKRFYLLTESEKRDVVILAHRLRPSVTNNVIFFEVGDQLLPSTPNDFMDVTDPLVKESFHVTKTEVIMDGSKYSVTKVMVYRPIWMYDFFEAPFREENWRIGLNHGIPVSYFCLLSFRSY